MRFWTTIGLILVLSTVGLTYEIAAGRVLAPYYGTSLVTWTTVIATVLAGFSLGNALGGMVAEKDHKTAVSKIRQALVATACLMALTPTILTVVYGVGARGTGGMVLAVIITFFPASVLVSLPSPYLAKYAVEARPGREGSSLGFVLAAGSIGAIFGAVLAGFVALPLIGSAMTFTVCGAVTLLCVLWIRGGPPVSNATLAPAVLVLGLSLMNGSYCRYESGQSCLDVQRDGDQILFISDRITQAAEYVSPEDNAEGESLALSYARMIWARMTTDLPDAPHMLFIGGGGYTLPSRLLTRYPEATAVAVEIDPMITAVVEEALPWAGSVIADQPRLDVVHADGRVFINDTDQRFDAAVMDAFSSGSVPAHLVTLETYQRLREVVDGPVYVNLIDKPDGALARGTHAILQEVYPHVAATMGPVSRRGLANIVLTGSPRPLATLAPMPEGFDAITLAEARPFTDDRGWFGVR